jgi:hypothetical protein
MKSTSKPNVFRDYKRQTCMKENPPQSDPQLTKALDRVPAPLRDRAAQTAKATLATLSAPSMKLTIKDDALEIGFDGAQPELATLLQMADLGTSDRDFHFGLVGQIASLGSLKRRIDSDNSNFVLAVVRSVNPRDGLEALLATQMGAIHAATMMMARRLNHVETIPQQDAAERALNKLARTFAIQMEALKRYRSSGQQKVTVEHVTVNAGGQAIVGAVETGGGGRK